MIQLLNMKKPMRKNLIAKGMLALGISFNAFADAPSVAVDIAPLHSLVSQVMKGIDKPDLLIPASASPHGYALKPSQAKALSEAEVVFWMGESYTPWLEKAMDNVADSAHKISVLELDSTTTYEFREGATFEEHAHHDEEEHHDEHEEEHGHHDEHDDHHDHGPGLIDRFLAFFSDEHDHHEDRHEEHHDAHEEHGDHHEDEHHHDHEGVDPHAWLDPQNAKAWITEIKNVLTKHDAANAATYEQNASKAIAGLDKLISETSGQIKELGELNFIVFHDAYQYFEKRFDISAAGSISLSDAEDPSPVRIAEIRDTVKKLGVNCVFSEPQFNAGLVKSVFDDSTNTKIGVMDPLGASIEPGSMHYAEVIKGMVASLGKCHK